MRFFERLAITIRRSPWLNKFDSLWNLVRPLYVSYLGRVCSSGLERVINGTDLVRLSPELYTYPEIYEPDVWHHILNEIQSGDVIADVGASVGLYTIAMAKRTGVEGFVYAFEPDPETVQFLQRNVQLNLIEDRVRVWPAAVTNQSGVVQFLDGRGSESRIIITGTERARPVEAVKLDDAFADVALDILKIDVEGFEEAVLQGGALLLKDNQRAPRAIFIEVHPFAWQAIGSSAENILHQLKDSGYKVLDLNNHPVEKISQYGKIIARKDRSQ